MPKKKVVLCNDGSLKTVVKTTISHESRVKQHRHGRGTAKYSDASYTSYGDVSAMKYMGYLLLWGSLIAGFSWVLWWVY